MNDFDKLTHWQKLLRGGDVLMGEVSRRMAGTTLALIDQGFERERDPYGERWAPKKRPDGRKVLEGRTGRLRRAWHSTRVSRLGYEVFPGVDYATYHQAPRMRSRARRRMVPSADQPFPRAWATALSRTAIQAMRSHYTSQP